MQPLEVVFDSLVDVQVTMVRHLWQQIGKRQKNKNKEMDAIEWEHAKAMAYFAKETFTSRNFLETHS